MAEQLPLPLAKRTALGRDDLFVAPSNAVALAGIDTWQNWPTGMMALVGPEGAGKTHIAHVFAAQSGARIVGPADIAGDAVPALATGPLAIDDADRVTDEKAFFHLYNMMRETRHPLLLTARSAPSRWALTLPDLISRLGTVGVIELGAPDDALLEAVFQKQFSDRGIVPQAQVIPYLVTRIERSLIEVARVVDQMDALAMAQGRPVGMRIAAQVLDKGGPDNA